MKRKKKLIENKTKWDKKSTFWSIIVFISLGIMFLTLNIPDYYRNKELEKYKGVTTGKVLSIKATETYTQGFDGGKKIAPFHTVIFTYKAYGVEYKNTNRISNKRKNRSFINKVLKSDYKKEFTIKYQVNNPKESLILIKP